MDGSSIGRVALLPLHPRFADAILDGVKRVELRRVPVMRDIDAVAMYVTAPVQRVVGWFTVADVVEASPSAAWREYGPVSGLSRREFRDYFSGSSRATVLLVKEPVRLVSPLCLDELSLSSAPQGLVYLSEDAVAALNAARTGRSVPVSEESSAPGAYRRGGSRHPSHVAAVFAGRLPARTHHARGAVE